MFNRKLICFLLIVHILPSESKTDSHRFWLQLVNNTKSSNDQTVGGKYEAMEPHHADFKCKFKCASANELAQKNQARFIHQGANDTIEGNEMEAPAAKFSVFNLLTDDEEGEEDDNNEDGNNDKIKNKVEENEDEDDDDIDGSGDDAEGNFNFFYVEDDVSPNKLKVTKQENLLKQYHRQRLRMHHLMFPLLLAYKLKFFTVIPLLLGLLVLLIGTTGVAGFFFALFAAALGIHVKMQHHHH